MAEFAASGYAVDFVPLTILAAAQSPDLMDTIKQVVTCGGDTDMIASMSGQFYGATYGTEASPIKVVNRIEDISVVHQAATKLSCVPATP